MNWEGIFEKPGPIVPRMVMQGECKVKKEKDNEKLLQFLKTLNEQKNEHQKLAKELKEQLKGLERIDLLVQVTMEQVEKAM